MINRRNACQPGFSDAGYYCHANESGNHTDSLEAAMISHGGMDVFIDNGVRSTIIPGDGWFW